MKRGKVYTDAAKRFDRERVYSPVEAFDLIASMPNWRRGIWG